MAGQITPLVQMELTAKNWGVGKTGGWAMVPPPILWHSCILYNFIFSKLTPFDMTPAFRITLIPSTNQFICNKKMVIKEEVKLDKYSIRP